MKKQYKSSRIKNHKITKEKFIDGVPLQGFRFGARNKKKKLSGNIQ